MTTEELQTLLDAATPGPWAVMEPTDWIMAGMMHVAQVRGYGWLTGHGGNGPKLSDADAMQVQTANARAIATWPTIAAELIAARAKLAAAERLVEALMPFSEAAEECDDYDHDDQQQAPVDAGQCRAARKAVAAWEDAK